MLHQPTPVILVADDDEDLRHILRLRLEAEGYAVVEAADGMQALEANQRHSPDLVLLDGMMPELDGIEVCRRLLGPQAESPPQVVLMTARSDDAMMRRAFEAGAADYIVKPPRWDVLRHRLRRLVRARRAEKDAADRSRLVVESPLPMMRVAADGTLRYANPACQPLLAAWNIQPGEVLPQACRRAAVEALNGASRREVELEAAGSHWKFVVAPDAAGGHVNWYATGLPDAAAAGPPRPQREE